MSMTSLTLTDQRVGWAARARDFCELTKPRISLMVLVTVTIAMLAAGARGELAGVMLATLVGTALVAASASASNQWIERERDARMERTKDRPLPAGRLGGGEVLSFALLTLVAGTVVLVVGASWQPALWALATWVVYVCVYTPLKVHTMWNTAIGAVSGALPVLIGWSAVSPLLDGRVAILFLILFLWQFPHFVAIAWIYRRQYTLAGMKMMTVIDPTGRSATWHALGGAGLLVVACGWAGWGAPLSTTGVAALLLAIVQFGFAWRFGRQLTDRAARQLLGMSILYLPIALALVAFGSVP